MGILGNRKNTISVMKERGRGERRVTITDESKLVKQVEKGVYPRDPGGPVQKKGGTLPTPRSA